MNETQLSRPVEVPPFGLRGTGQFTQVYRFAPEFKDILLMLADMPGCEFSLSDFGIDGSAGLPEFPRDAELPPWRANGLVVSGKRVSIERVRISDIPGTALVLENGWCKLDNVSTQRNRNGVIVMTHDTKLRSLTIDDSAYVGLRLIGGGACVDGSHICGARTACVIEQPAMLRGCYHEGAEIGTDILEGASGTQMSGLNIGPGTCSRRGVRIGAHGCSVSGLHGAVPGTSKEHPDSAGVEVLPGLTNETISGELVLGGDGAVGCIFQGATSTLDLKGGWNGPVRGTFVRVAGPITGCEIKLRGHGGGGEAVLDLRDSQLDKVNGQGNDIDIKWAPGTTPAVLYPGGSKKYNLAPGTQLKVNGVLQGKDK